ncbi:hypothetical protein EC973_004374 [Apophysomyces ossiformis]|uniref:C3H1-type domain-containing protein n=1 Tax=Apophysomyces ossiformis TaxID=679940 RepID=A0A8H7BQ68_9FUNG|nr:hypothetical protein EC973_004374 [Apophysomyces ossiformis]
MNKPPCRHFFTHGYCEYELSCKYSHVTLDMTGQPILPPELIRWFQAQQQQQHEAMILATAKAEAASKKKPKYRLPKGWKVQDLPPSLKPPPKQGYEWTHTGYWG